MDAATDKCTTCDRPPHPLLPLSSKVLWWRCLLIIAMESVGNLSCFVQPPVHGYNSVCLWGAMYHLLIEAVSPMEGSMSFLLTSAQGRVGGECERSKLHAVDRLLLLQAQVADLVLWPGLPIQAPATDHAGRSHMAYYLRPWPEQNVVTAAAAVSTVPPPATLDMY